MATLGSRSGISNFPDRQERGQAAMAEGANIAGNKDLCLQCLCCQYECSLAMLKEFNPARAYIRVIYDENFLTEGYQFTEDCTWCGLCVDACPSGALQMIG